jgi:hypothetical protein
MPQDPNVKLIIDVTRDWVTGKYEKILPFVADKAVYIIARGKLEAFSKLFGTFRGKPAITRWYAENKRVIQSGGIHPFCSPTVFGKYIAVGKNQVLNYGTMPKTSAAPPCDWVALWTLSRGKITECWLVMDTTSAFLKLKKANPRLALK